MINEIEPWAYRYGLKPTEFWNLTYREIKLYIDSNSLQREEDLKTKIIILEQFGNKIIGALNLKKPKNKSLIKDVFKELFKEELEPKPQTIEEQIRIMRSWD